MFTFSDRLGNLSEFGIQVHQSGGKVKATRDGCGAFIEDSAEGPKVSRLGVLIGDDIGVLVHGGYQMFFRATDGVTRPALAPQLKSLHAFQEDLREGLGFTSHYNESLGTVCTGHMYDRVRGR